MKILTLKKSVDPSQRNDTQKLILVDLVDDEDLRPQTDPPTLTMRDLKKWKELFTHLDRYCLIITLLYIGFGNRIYLNIFNVITN